MTYRNVVTAGHDKLGARYRDLFGGSPVRMEYVQRVRQRLAPGSIVVDLGCGPGDPTTRLLAADPRGPRRGRGGLKCPCTSAASATTPPLAAVRAAGLTIEASEVSAETDPDGHLSRFHWITATEPPPATMPGH